MSARQYIREAIRVQMGIPEPKTADDERFLDLVVVKELLSTTYTFHRNRYRDCEDCSNAILEVRSTLQILQDTFEEEQDMLLEREAFRGAL